MIERIVRTTRPLCWQPQLELTWVVMSLGTRGTCNLYLWSEEVMQWFQCYYNPANFNVIITFATLRDSESRHSPSKHYWHYNGHPTLSVLPYNNYCVYAGAINHVVFVDRSYQRKLNITTKHVKFRIKKSGIQLSLS